MNKHIKQIFSGLLDHYPVVSLLLALVILTRSGVGEVKIISLLGILLCMLGMLQPAAKVDLWTFIPLVVYNLVSMASSYAVYGNITDGYASTQMIFPVIYLLMASLEKRERYLLNDLCIAWAGVLALGGIGQFIAQTLFLQRAWRVGGWLGNPNAMGIFLVVGWFSLLYCISEKREQSKGAFFFFNMEPVLLIALALTLSMGSFLAMAAGILVLVGEKKRCSSWRDAFSYACCLLGRASLGIGTGLLIYLAAARTSVPFLCIPLLAYAVAVMWHWKTYVDFLVQKRKTAAVISALGVLVAVAAVAVRPSALSTFAERLEMMQNGLSYFTRNPLLGVGPYQWRLLNLHDSSKYFNTWHIHNLFIHIGVELGWIALAMLLLIAVRFYRKHTEPAAKAGFTAFCFHNLMDTSFFYMGILALVMLVLGSPENKGRTLHTGVFKVILAVFAVMFAYHLFYYLHVMW